MAHSSESSRPAALANVPGVTTEQDVAARAKRIGGPITGHAYRRAKTIVAHVVRMAIAEHTTQRDIARAAGVTQRLVQQWIDADGSNGLRLDVALAIAEDGGISGRNVVIQVLREVLAVAEQGLRDQETK